MRMRILSLVLPLALIACARGDIVSREPPAGYLPDAAARVAAADWSATEDVTLTLSEFSFAPDAPVFRAGVPTRLTLRNDGDRPHTFRSEAFFKAIAAQRLVSADGEIANPYPETIAVPAGQSKQLYFVPIVKGTYAFECSVPLHDVFGMQGQVRIE